MLTDLYGFDGNDSRYRTCVKRTLEKRFGKDIVFITVEHNEPEIVSKAISHSTADNFFENAKKERFCHVLHLFFIYFSSIFREDIETSLESASQKNNPWPPESISSSEEKYPKSLITFLSELLKIKKHSHTEIDNRHVKSFTQDIIHSISHGKFLTLKHTLLGCGIHSVTGLRKPIDILLSFGHSCTYDKVRNTNCSS